MKTTKKKKIKSVTWCHEFKITLNIVLKHLVSYMGRDLWHYMIFIHSYM